MKHLNLLALGIACAAIAGCGTVAKVSADIDQDMAEKSEVPKTPFVVAPRSRIDEVRGSFLPVTPITSKEEGEWLRRHMVSLDIKNPTPLSAVIAKFSEQGINITTDLPISSYTYAGKVNRTNAETALRAVLGSIGLDYQIDDKRQLVLIRPIASRSWYVNIGNRRSTFSSDKDGSKNSSGADNSSGFGNNQSSGFGGGQNGMPSMGAVGGTMMTGSGLSNNSSGSGSNGSSNSSESNTYVRSYDDFWSSLERELQSRLSILMPTGAGFEGSASAGASSSLPPIPPLPPGMTGGSPIPSPIMQAGGPRSSNGELYSSRRVGMYALNPETGSITVQAPHWILTELDSYISGVQEMYNTEISFQGEVVLVTTNRANSEGFDLSTFRQWASGKFGAVFANNSLGGVTMSLPTDIATGGIAAGTQSVGGPLAGFRYRSGANALDLFSNYLSEIGKVSVIQRPIVSTSSGVPGIFSKKDVDYYNTVSQQAAAGGTGSAATATQNIIVPVETGIELRINPRVDVATGLIRAQLTLEQVIQSGVRNIPQVITFGDNAQQVNTQIPILAKQEISGEVLLRDGDLIIVGGQTEGNMTVDERGVPDLNGNPIGGFLGTKESKRGAQTYYFALRVSVQKRR